VAVVVEKVDLVKPSIKEVNFGNRIIFKNDLCPGDCVVSTAAIQCLHEQHPGKYITDIECSCPAVFEANPFITKLDSGQPIRLEYPLINESNQRIVHFMQGYVEFLADKLKISLKLTVNRPYIYISEDEKKWIGRVEELVGKKKYVVINAGWKDDYQVKKWPHSYWQEVVKAFPKVTFVQVGETHHNHPVLDGVINQIGKTNARELIRLIWHPDCDLVMTGVSFTHHLAAAFEKPCITIASGMEPIHWEKYPTSIYLSSHGLLPCCQKTACWKAKLDGSGNNCIMVGKEAAACMEMVTPDRVIKLISQLHFCQPCAESR
jgi:ADP-heptose:LPS heptosyltransferase